MNARFELSERDETLAQSYYSGAASVIQPMISLARFEYSFRRQSLLQDVVHTFHDQLTQDLPEEHRRLLEQGEEQSEEDLSLVARMLAVQQEAFAL